MQPQDLMNADAVLEEEDTQKDMYLAFNLADESYALSVRDVVEIVGFQSITEVPDTPVYVKGVINLRGQIIPVVDVRLRFKLEPKAYEDRTCIIIISAHEMTVGLIVDEVAEVLTIPEEMVTPPIKTGKGAGSRYIQGIGRLGEQVKLILSTDSLLDVDDAEAVQAAAV